MRLLLLPRPGYMQMLHRLCRSYLCWLHVSVSKGLSLMISIHPSCIAGHTITFYIICFFSGEKTKHVISIHTIPIIIKYRNDNLRLTKIYIETVLKLISLIILNILKLSYGKNQNTNKADEKSCERCVVTHITI
jgi:hypothetical protein